MRIAVLTSSFPRYPGDSAAPFVDSLSRAIAKAGHDVQIVAPYDPKVQTEPSVPLRVHWFRYAWPASLHVMGYGRSLRSDWRLDPWSVVLLPAYLVAAFIALWKVTSEHKTDIIHAHWVLPNGLAAAWVAVLRRIPLVISLHGSDMFVATRSRLFGPVASWVFRHSAAVSACSPELRAAALSLGAPSWTELIPWGADPAVFKPRDPADSTGPSSIREDRRVTVIALGRLVPKKGFDVLLDAWSEVSGRDPEVCLVIGGDGALRAALEEKARRQRSPASIRFVGRVAWSGVPAFLAAGDIFVLPSVRDQHGNVDGLPTVLLEAMSCGLAVVASDIGGVALVVADGETGYLVPPGEAGKLASAIEFLIENPKARRRIAWKARQAVEDSFTWRDAAFRMLELFNRARSIHSAGTGP